MFPRRTAEQSLSRAERNKQIALERLKSKQRAASPQNGNHSGLLQENTMKQNRITTDKSSFNINLVKEPGKPTADSKKIKTPEKQPTAFTHGGSFSLKFKKKDTSPVSSNNIKTPEKQLSTFTHIGSFSPKFKKKDTLPASSNNIKTPEKQSSTFTHICSFSPKFKKKDTLPASSNNIKTPEKQSSTFTHGGSFSPKFKKKDTSPASSNNIKTPEKQSLTFTHSGSYSPKFKKKDTSPASRNNIKTPEKQSSVFTHIGSFSPKFKKKDTSPANSSNVRTPEKQSSTITHGSSFSPKFKKKDASAACNNNIRTPEKQASAISCGSKNTFDEGQSYFKTALGDFLDDLVTAEHLQGNYTIQVSSKVIFDTTYNQNPNVFRIPSARSCHSNSDTNKASSSLVINGSYSPKFKNRNVSTSSNDVNNSNILSNSQNNGHGSFSPKFKSKNISANSDNAINNSNILSNQHNHGSFSPKFKSKNVSVNSCEYVHGSTQSTIQNLSNNSATFSSEKQQVGVRKQLFSPEKNNDNSQSIFSNSQSSPIMNSQEQIMKNKMIALEKLKAKQLSSSPCFSQSISNTDQSSQVKQNYSDVTLTLSIKNDVWFQVSHDKMFSSTVQRVARKISNRSFNVKEGFWLFHINDYLEVVQLFCKELPCIEMIEIPFKVIKTFQDANKKLKNTKVDLKNISGKLLDRLMPFQKEGVMFGIRNNGRVLFGDDMGLGKTIEAIAICSYYKDDWPILVICPSSMKTSWQQHFVSWIDEITENDINVVHKSKDDVEHGKVLIVSYDLATKFTSAIQQRNFKIVIADESHFLKNHQALRTKNLVPILQTARRAILLSGTPALSRPKELFMQVKALRPNLFPNYKEFSIRYCDGREGRFGWEDNGCTNSEELNYLLKSSVMIRRLKDDVLDQLPEKRRQIVVLDESLVKSSKELKFRENSFISSSNKEKRNSLMQYYDCTCDAKIKGVNEYVSEQLESGKKILVFAHHMKMLDAIEDMTKKKKIGYIRIDGRTNSKNRQILIDEFTTSPRCLLGILSITAAGTGLNITASSFVIFAELYWNPGHLIQAEDRAYRYGQKNSVLVTYIVAKKTADDYIWPMVSSKLKVLSELGVGMSKDLKGSTTTYIDPQQRQINEFFEELNTLELEETLSQEPLTKKQRIS